MASEPSTRSDVPMATRAVISLGVRFVAPMTSANSARIRSRSSSSPKGDPPPPDSTRSSLFRSARRVARELTWAM